MHDPDRHLVERAKAGDRGAFGKLATRHYELVYAVAFGVLGNREDALDVAQEALMKAFLEIQKFQGESKFRTWLYRISVNAAIDASRRKRPTEPIEERIDLRAHEPSPREEAHRREIRGLVRNALDLLSPEHRTILVLREWHELSYDEIAETLQIEVGTVMSRLFYARKKLAEALGANVKGEVP
ncbi:MAG: sigma-70 family RNA polymerase sigma factor [Candidatus Omnitrophica bacterium]|nr:sigma-70 family RNA polymerase sigma factor [Candidatus Omnitrophota bacterium]